MKNQIKEYQPIIVFKGKNIRRTLHNNDWWFVVKDIVEALTDTANVTNYLKKMRQRDPQLSEGWGQIVTPFSVETTGGPQKLNCANKDIVIFFKIGSLETFSEFVPEASSNRAGRELKINSEKGSYKSYPVYETEN